MLPVLLATVIAAAPVNHIDTNSLNAAMEQAKANGCAVIKQIDLNEFKRNDADLLAKLEQLGINISDLENCLGIKFPECNTPETDTPETDTPETDTPDTDSPGITPPGPDTPETDAPVVTPPETEAPDTDAPETDASPELSIARQVAALVNQERAKAGLSPLEIKVDIETAALTRAKEIETSFSHTRPDGRSFSTALTDANENSAEPEKILPGGRNHRKTL